MLCTNCSTQAGARTREAVPFALTDDGQIRHHGLPPNPHHEFPDDTLRFRRFGDRVFSLSPMSRRLTKRDAPWAPQFGAWQFGVEPASGRVTIRCERCDLYVTDTNQCAVRVLSPWRSVSAYHGFASRSAIEAVGRAQEILTHYFGRVLALQAAHKWAPGRTELAARARRVLQAFHAVDHVPGCSYADAYEQLAIADDADELAGEASDAGAAIRARLFLPVIEALASDTERAAAASTATAALQR